MAKRAGRKAYWIWWGALSVAIGGYLALGLLSKSAATNPLLAPARSIFLPGKTSHGHYQIELSCESCHGTPFGGREALQESCERCHGQELKDAVDKHPRSKFTDPRNADRLEKLDALQCVTCHVEHRPEITHAMGVTLPADFCFHCHQDIAKDRPSHKGMAFDTCNSAGCHKFHDNRALYEDFLTKHLTEPAQLKRTQLPARNFREVFADFPGYPSDRFPPKPQTSTDAPREWTEGKASREIAGDWLATAHARSGVNCSGCHQPEKDEAGSDATAQKEKHGTDRDGAAKAVNKDGANKDGANKEARAIWVRRPDHKVCATCHEPEHQGFLAGKHGMRLKEGLAPMTPAAARQPMNTKVRNTQLGCTTCHGAHRFDTRKAAVEACVGCHRDEHTRAYERSPHFALWKKEMAGELPAGSGVSCASCHLPRVEHRSADASRRIAVQHNQNDSLRPNEKMIRPVCMNCHGLGFSIDALADPKLVANNFAGAPALHIKSLDMVAERMKELEGKRRRKQTAAAAAE